MSHDSRVWITPVYQGVLGRALGYVVMSFADNDPPKTWNSLRTLFCVSPGETQKDCEELHDEIEKKVEDITMPRSLRNAGVQVETERTLNKYLFVKNYEFFKKIVASLMDHGYLETKWSRVKTEDFQQLEAQE